MKLNLLAVCLCVGMLFAAFSTVQAAEREDVIAQSLDCMQKSHTAGAVNYKDICVLNNDGLDAKRPSVKVKTEPIKVESKVHSKTKAVASPEPLSLDEPADLGTLPKSREDSWSYTYFNFDENELNDFSLATEVFGYRYAEPSLMKNTGTMLGVQGVYTHRTKVNKEVSGMKEVFSHTNGINVVRLEARYAADNNMKYQSEGTGELMGEKHFIVETRAVVGYDFPYNQKHLFTPYAGVGYWGLKDHDGRKLTTTGHSSYNREQEYFYIPLGIDYEQKMEHGLSVALNLEYDYLVSGRNESYIQGLAFVGWDSNPYFFNDQGKHTQRIGHGYRGSVKVAKEIGPVELFAEPFFSMWNIAASDVIYWQNNVGTIVGSTTEPKNLTTEYGLKMGINF